MNRPMMAGRGPLGRREFFGWAGSGAMALGVVGVGGSRLLLPRAFAADAPPTTEPAAPVSVEEATEQSEAIVGDVVEFALASDEWPGEFGFVTMRVHAGVVDGNDVYFVRTDTSDEAYAAAEQLVFVPKIASLSGEGLSGDAYVVEDDADQPVVFSTEPGREDYTPAWTLHRVTWTAEPRRLGSVTDVTTAEEAGELTVERTPIVFNAGIVKWSNGEMAVDEERTGYLGQGQLLAPVDTAEMTAMFKLGQCYPGSRYFVLDHSIAPVAEMTLTVTSPRLHQGPSEAGATGRTNVFMNGIEGPGPMGFQPSAFDWDAGDPAWSPFWDHYTYAWRDGVEPRVLTSQQAIHEARDAGELDEFPGMPDTQGEVFTVNCPVPVLAPITFTPG
jgi:hypothetical protein